ncbi:MAG: hypothetical protein WCX28_05310, partial [Bacteriovoracaceae bacterium]
DAPHRLDPDQPFPILILIKDADLYPVDMVSIRVTLYHDARKEYTHTYEFAQPLKIRSHFWHKIVDLHFTGTLSSLFGMMYVDVEISTVQNGKITIMRNNNHRFTSKAPLKFYRSKTHLPSINGWKYGDTHTHSTYTEDQVEFGSPIEAAPRLCRAMGMSFFGVMDHSYDLDDRVDNYLLNDPALPKWDAMHGEIDRVNTKEKDFAVLRGEEVTCRNADGKNVHFLLFGTRRFFHGSGDSAEKWLQTKSEYTIQDVLQQKDRSVVAFASHPTEEVPVIQKLLLNRDEWTIQDMAEKELHGIQILNGVRSDAFYRGMDIWKWMLNRGMKKFILAGNDAHGNFNRFIQISIPMLSFREKESQLFGKMKTAVLTHTLSEEAIIESLGKGNTVITNGPLLTIGVETDAPDVGIIGETVGGKKFVVKLHGETTDEFGQLKCITVYMGSIGKGERVLFEIKQFSNPHSIHRISDWHHAEFFSYIRAEVSTHHPLGIDGDGFCYTNPIWIQPK